MQYYIAGYLDSELGPHLERMPSKVKEMGFSLILCVGKAFPVLLVRVASRLIFSTGRG